MECLKDFWCILGHDSFKSLVIIAGVIVAITSVLTARQLARCKQAADLLFSSRSDIKLQTGLKIIRQYYESPDKNIRSLADQETEEANCICYALNHFETVSIGIQSGIYDENMIKKSWYSTLVKTYDRTLPLISATRGDQKHTIWQEFEWLAGRWKKKPLKRRRQ